MSLTRIFCLLITLLMTVGCTTFGQQGAAPWPWKDRMPCKEGKACEVADAREAYAKASEFCRQVHSYYESQGLYSDSGRLGVGIVGVLAGTVASPLSSGAAAKAWAGLSGATNGLQTQMDGAFSGAISIRRQEGINAARVRAAQDFHTAMTATWYATKPNYDIAVMRAVDMAAACSMGASQADRETLKALDAR